MKTALLNTWKWIDGNKTIILWGTSVALQQAVKVGLLNDSKGIQWAIGITLTLGGGAAAHHIQKGFFTTKKGN